ASVRPPSRPPTMRIQRVHGGPAELGLFWLRPPFRRPSVREPNFRGFADLASTDCPLENRGRDGRGPDARSGGARLRGGRPRAAVSAGGGFSFFVPNRSTRMRRPLRSVISPARLSGLASSAILRSARREPR